MHFPEGPLRILIAAFLSALTATPSLAQHATQPCTPGVSTAQFMGANGLVKAPFTGTIQTTSETRLNDGTLLGGSFSVQVARDSTGRTYNESAMYCERDQEGNAHLIKMVSVSDFAAQTFTNWTSGHDSGGVARVQHFSAHVQTEPQPQPLYQPQQVHREQIQTENLGTKTVAGLLAEGTRTTLTYPAGEVGNSQPFSVVDEHWYCKDLQMDISVTHDDPRSGKITSEFTTLTPGEPEPTLFQPPANYTIRDIPNPVP